jgi:hypothetical protein
MNTRTFFKSLAALAMSPLAALAKKPELPPLPIIKSTTTTYNAVFWLDEKEWREWPENIEEMRDVLIAEWNDTHDVKMKSEAQC